ncbi:alpha/beta hydrolase [Escherichia coli]|nr:alpha/beta hydrolase [Escherichia coli]
MIVFLHGWTMCGAVFDDIRAALSPEFDSLAPDMPGHCAAADEPPSLTHAAQMVEDLLAGQGGKAVLVGWSMGAAVAWHYIRRFGTSRLAGLVTLDMSPRIVTAPDWPHGLLGQSAQDIAASSARLTRDWPGMAAAISATMFARPPQGEPALRDWAQAQILRCDPDLMRALWQDMVMMDCRDDIGRITVPYIAAYGGQSRVYPASAATWLADAAPQGRAHEFARSGHSPHLEQPGEFTTLIRDFARSL